MFLGSTFLGGKAAIGAPDVTPDAVDWTDVTAGSVGTGFVAANTNSQTISGINMPISLKVTWTGAGTLAMNINGTPHAMSSGGALTVNNADVVYFNLSATSTSKSGAVTVVNASDVGPPTLDTFNYALTIA